MPLTLLIDTLPQIAHILDLPVHIPGIPSVSSFNSQVLMVFSSCPATIQMLHTGSISL
ncbi:hypothetical protein [uncultured Faecalibaculum sp.]|uniref:hypothetical protein n=1 Tax=uncultured Faecalibaculum sp. TaxID=1729681 RepID=UPI002616A0A0|nr:hypothetical protein [uncultured Faecalibaculum sp.]